jgi:hypothetical protein
MRGSSNIKFLSLFFVINITYFEVVKYSLLQGFKIFCPGVILYVMIKSSNLLIVILLQYSLPVNHPGKMNYFFDALRFHSAREISSNI